MRTAYAISAAGHAAVLIWSVWSLAARPLPAPPSEALPVDIVSVSEFTKITEGSKSAPQVETPKPLAERVAEAKPVEDPTAKVEPKKEVKAAREPPPAAESKPVEAKPESKPAESKVDAIAEALAKEPKTPAPKKAQAKPPTPPTPPKQPAPPAPKFDPRQVEALLNKRTATRVAAAGETLNNTSSLGLPNANAGQMSLSELDALRQRLERLWNPPVGNKDPQELVVQVRFQLKPDRTLAGRVEVLNSGTSPLWVAARDSAIRALYAGQPFDMLKPEHYEQWKDIEITFDPRYMMRGY